MTQETQHSGQVKAETAAEEHHVHGPGCSHHHHHHQVETYVRAQPKVGRNDPCPCGSGKKSKKCCH